MPQAQSCPNRQATCLTGVVPMESGNEGYRDQALSEFARPTLIEIQQYQDELFSAADAPFNSFFSLLRNQLVPWAMIFAVLVDFSLALQLDLFERRGIRKARNQAEPRLLHTGTDPVDRG